MVGFSIWFAGILIAAYAIAAASNGNALAYALGLAGFSLIVAGSFAMVDANA